MWTACLCNAFNSTYKMMHIDFFMWRLSQCFANLHNRFHNYVVEQLAVINEGGRFTKPSDSTPPELRDKAWAKYDNDLFQVGRLYVLIDSHTQANEY